MTNWEHTVSGPGAILALIEEGDLGVAHSGYLFHAYLRRLRRWAGNRRVGGLDDLDEVLDHAHTLMVQGGAGDDDVDVMLDGLYDWADDQHVIVGATQWPIPATLRPIERGRLNPRDAAA